MIATRWIVVDTISVGIERLEGHCTLAISIVRYGSGGRCNSYTVFGSLRRQIRIDLNQFLWYTIGLRESH